MNEKLDSSMVLPSRRNIVRLLETGTEVACFDDPSCSRQDSWCSRGNVRAVEWRHAVRILEVSSNDRRLQILRALGREPIDGNRMSILHTPIGHSLLGYGNPHGHRQFGKNSGRPAKNLSGFWLAEAQLKGCLRGVPFFKANVDVDSARDALESHVMFALLSLLWGDHITVRVEKAYDLRFAKPIHETNRLAPIMARASLDRIEAGSGHQSDRNWNFGRNGSLQRLHGIVKITSGLRGGKSRLLGVELEMDRDLLRKGFVILRFEK